MTVFEKVKPVGTEIPYFVDMFTRVVASLGMSD